MIVYSFKNWEEGLKKAEIGRTVRQSNGPTAPLPNRPTAQPPDCPRPINQDSQGVLGAAYSAFTRNFSIVSILGSKPNPGASGTVM